MVEAVSGRYTNEERLICRMHVRFPDSSKSWTPDFSQCGRMRAFTSSSAEWKLLGFSCSLPYNRPLTAFTFSNVT